MKVLTYMQPFEHQHQCSQCVTPNRQHVVFGGSIHALAYATHHALHISTSAKSVSLQEMLPELRQTSVQMEKGLNPTLGEVKH